MKPGGMFSFIREMVFIVAGALLALIGSFVVIMVFGDSKGVVSRSIVWPLMLAAGAYAGGWLVFKLVKLRAGTDRESPALNFLCYLCLFSLLFLPAMNRNIGQRSSVAKAQADVRALASAVTMYQAHMGTSPATLQMLTASSSNALGKTLGPFLTVIPSPPPGWSPYSYTYQADGMFTISATGDHTTARVP